MDKQKLFSALDERMVETIDLGEFHERLAGQTVEVWLNPPRAKMQELAKIEDDEARGVQRIGVQLGLSADDAKELFAKDAAFCNWLIDRVMEKTAAYAEGRRKKSVTG